MGKLKIYEKIIYCAAVAVFYTAKTKHGNR